ncbi:MAG: hypothetical protein WKF64_09640, partial [Ilumatobacteraceae bacterium]
MEHLQIHDYTVGDRQEAHRRLVEALFAPRRAQAPDADDLGASVEQHLASPTRRDDRCQVTGSTPRS